MYVILKKTMLLVAAVSITGFFLCSMAHASGMLPETSMVIVNEADGETSMNVKNTDSTAALLYTSIQNLSEDKENLLVVTPPVARVEPDETQLVRFILQNKEPLKVQRFKRVIFEGIPQQAKDGGVKVTMHVRQNLPVIIHPRGLALNREPWKLLSWSLKDGKLTSKNDSAYVVRLAQNAILLPNKVEVDLGKTYFLPGEVISVPVSKSDATPPTTVRISPATVYGFSVDCFDATLIN